jgi:hypothetical protein
LKIEGQRGGSPRKVDELKDGKGDGIEGNEKRGAGTDSAKSTASIHGGQTKAL